MTHIRPTLLTVLLGLWITALPTVSHATDRYLSLILGTQHFGNELLNNKTPGIALGTRWQGRRDRTEWFVEGGVFYNSYEETSPIVMIGTSAHLAQIGSVEIRGGLAVGTAYYKTLSRDLETKYKIPNIGGFIPMLAASLAFRSGDHELRLTTVPPDDDTDFILNASWAFQF